MHAGTKTTLYVGQEEEEEVEEEVKLSSFKTNF